MTVPNKRGRHAKVGLCNCGEELRKKGIFVQNRCDGTKYMSKTTCRNHYKSVIDIIKRRVKNARKKMEEEPVLLPKFIHRHEIAGIEAVTTPDVQRLWS